MIFFSINSGFVEPGGGARGGRGGRRKLVDVGLSERKFGGGAVKGGWFAG